MTDRSPDDLSLPELEREVLSLHGSLHVRTDLDAARRIGELLLEVKARLGHGRYLPWLKRVGLPTSTAHDYVTVSKAPHFRRSGSIRDVVLAVRTGRRVLRRERREAMSRAAAASVDKRIVTTDALDWLRGRPDGSVPFVVSDPPYGKGTDFDGWRDPDTPDAYWNWLSPIWAEVRRVLVPGGAAVLWQAFDHLPYLPVWFPGASIIASCYTIRGVRQWEPVVRWTKPGAGPLVRHDGLNDWINGSTWYRGESGEFKAVHPCPKPLNDCREVVRRYTLPGSLVVDPFCGVGTIPLACKLERRAYIGVERSERYAAVARERLAAATGGDGDPDGGTTGPPTAPAGRERSSTRGSSGPAPTAAT